MANQKPQDRVKELIEKIAAQVAEITDSELKEEMDKSVDELLTAFGLMDDELVNVTNAKSMVCRDWMSAVEDINHYKETLRHLTAIIAG